MTNHLIDEVLGYVTTLTVEGASCGASIESGVDTPVRSLSNARYASRWMKVRGQCMKRSLFGQIGGICRAEWQVETLSFEVRILGAA